MADFITQGFPGGRKKVDPSLSDLLLLWAKQIKLDINCHAVGTIESFNSTLQTASISLNYTKTFTKRNLDGTYSSVQKDYPLLIDVPIIIFQGGNFCLTFPNEKGDGCQILFNDRDIDKWITSGQVGQVNTPRLHSLSDAVAIVGLNPQTSPILLYDSGHACLRTKDGTVVLGISSSKVLIQNTIGTLNDLLQELIDEVKDLVTATAAITVTGVTTGPGVSGPPVNAATITAINTQIIATATKIGGLLE